MKHRRLLAALTGAGAVVTGVTAWAVASHLAADPDSEARTSANRVLGEADSALQEGIRKDQKQDYHGAARSYRRVLELDPRNKFAWYNLGVIAQRAGSTSEARADYDEALKTDPSLPQALFNKAILLKSSEPAESIGLLRRAIAAKPGASTAHLQLADILAQQKRVGEAVDEYRRAVAADPSLFPQVPPSYRESLAPSPATSRAGDDE
ncbi:tetratricopeptide repeat protein [Streptomyces sp. NPDC006012]|uniref:tetratricopeptide repeat protein n=1 Tax=Streptomyces sp. NPDC006012 TaxID=3364739 RepID=UPI0036A77C7A